MLLNSQNLNALRVGFNTAFQSGLGSHESQYGRIATTITSTDLSERYGWMANSTGLRKWVGDRVVKNLSEYDYEVKNEVWEETIAVDKYHIEFDRLGTYATRFQMMGANAAAFPDELVFGLLKAGFTSDCYDGQFFFDTDHPVLDKDGNKTTVSNMAAGGSTPWYLLSTSRPLKPLIYQTLKPWELVAMDGVTDANVFNRKEYVYGTEGASNAGFGFWQTAFGSQLALDPTNYEAARGAMMGFTNDGGKPLGITPDLLVVPPSLEGAARRIVGNELTGGGNTNEWYKTADVLVVPWLA